MKLYKVKRIEISFQVLADFLKKAIANKVPQDAEILRVNYNVLTNNFDLIVQSEEYEKIKEGSEVPRAGDPVVSSDVLK